ncbi:unnamed protein product [Blumeria hordei]|uniref:Uncharacterized protein n=1 Tax=Blumeria hordei TaxID=2867405 RepID=A0A383UZP7_BLUHO|nr:unnamed protein product [Blumeria hordei]
MNFESSFEKSETENAGVRHVSVSLPISPIAKVESKDSKARSSSIVVEMIVGDDDDEKKKGLSPILYILDENSAEITYKQDSGKINQSRRASRVRDARGTREFIDSVREKLRDCSRFVGPGFMVSVAYIDPGNYAIDVKAGSTFRFKLLCVGLMANIFAIFFQALCVKLGSVSGLNLAQACRMFLPKWLNYFLYALAEVSIIASDVTEVVGFTIATNLLVPKMPMMVGCFLSILDVLFVRALSSQSRSMKGVHFCEFIVMTLVMAVVGCFCVQLCLSKAPTIKEVLCGYLPSRDVFRSQGIYQGCGIIGATIMPHSLYLGSNLIQPRLREYEIKHGVVSASSPGIDESVPYQPSPKTINSFVKLCILELSISLFIFAFCINSAVLITAGASLYGKPTDDANLFGIHALLTGELSSAAGTIFALALLISGGSAAIICTVAGEIVSKGAINWKMEPWVRRLLTRSISVVPTLVIAASGNKGALDDVLMASQVILCMILPFTTAPLIFFTCLDRYMTVRSRRSSQESDKCDGSDLDPSKWNKKTREKSTIPVDQIMGNNWLTTIIAITIWLVIVTMNVANLLGKVFFSMGIEHGNPLIN